MTKVKICCIADIHEALLAIDLGASALGFVSEMPSGPGVVSENVIRETINEVPTGILNFLLSSKTSSRELISQLAYTGANTIQLVNYVEADVYPELRTYSQSLNIVQVIHVLSQKDIELASNLSSHVDMILLDSGNPNASTPTLGGTGNTHNWEISKEIVQAVDVPVFLAGGLRSDNVEKAIEYVGPFGLDLCSSVRRQGKLDRELLEEFMAGVRRAESGK